MIGLSGCAKQRVKAVLYPVDPRVSCANVERVKDVILDPQILVGLRGVLASGGDEPPLEWIKANRWTKDWAVANPDATGQGPWFRRDPRVRWVDIEHDPVAEAAPAVVAALTT